MKPDEDRPDRRFSKGKRPCVTKQKWHGWLCSPRSLPFEVSVWAWCCLSGHTNQFSKAKVYVAVQRTPDRAQAAAADGRVVRMMVEPHTNLAVFKIIHTSAVLWQWGWSINISLFIWKVFMYNMLAKQDIPVTHAQLEKIRLLNSVPQAPKNKGHWVNTLILYI